MFLASEFSKWVQSTQLTQKEVAKNLAVSRSHLNSVMVGKADPGSQFLDKAHQLANEGLRELRWCFYDPGLASDNQVIMAKTPLKLLLSRVFERVIAATQKRRELSHAASMVKIENWVKNAVEGSLLALMRGLDRAPEQKDEVLKDHEQFLAEQINNMFRFVLEGKEDGISWQDAFPTEDTADMFNEELHFSEATRKILYAPF